MWEKAMQILIRWLMEIDLEELEEEKEIEVSV